MAENQNEELLKLCREIVSWQKIAYGDKVGPLLKSLLDDPRKIQVYQFSDGENTTRILSKKVGAGTGSISRWWTLWINRGIAIPIPKAGGARAKRLFELED